MSDKLRKQTNNRELYVDAAVNLEVSQTSNLSAQIYSDLRMKLIVGDLRPDETLSIRTLAEEYNISAMPVREALRQLASEDVLIGAAKKAYRVPDLSPSEAANLFFVRAVLEGAAAEIAAQNVSDADIQVLDKLRHEIDEAWAEKNASRFLLLNFQFHGRIYQLANNKALESMIECLYARTGPWLAHGITNLVSIESWQSDHFGILQALRDRDPVRARKMVEEDVRWGVELYLSHDPSAD